MDTFTGIIFSPALPWGLLAALAAAGLLIGGYGVLRRARGAVVRLIPLAALVLALANPQWVTEKRDPLTDVAVIAVDDTLSQQLGGRRGEADAALESLLQATAPMGDLETRVVRIDGGAAGGTRVADTLREAFADVPRERRAGAVLITDGQIHDADAIRDMGAPVHALLTGDPEAEDRVLLIDGAPGFGLVGKAVSVTVTAEDPAMRPGEPVVLTIDRNDGRPRTLTLPANTPTAIALDLSHAGDNVFALSLPDRDGELSPVNNRAAVSVNGVRDRLRVLLISGQPHAGERTWRNLLKADPSVDLIHFTILRPPRKEDLTPLSELALIAFPIQELFEEKLEDFDLIVFDRYSRRGLVADAYLSNIARYVENGGALMLSVGPEITEPFSLAQSALSDVLPGRPTGEVRTGAFRPALTAVGQRHPVTAGLPGAGDDSGTPASWGRWIRQVVMEGSRGAVVMRDATAQPLLTLDRVGDGRVALLSSDTIWLWAKGWDGGGPQGELMRRVAHWLMKEPELEEEALRARVDDDRLTVTGRSLDAPPDRVTVTAPDGSTTPLALGTQGAGLTGGSMPAALPGIYRVETPDGGLGTLAVAGPPNPLETTRLVPTEAALAPVAEDSGGGLFHLTDGLPNLRRPGPGQGTAGDSWLGLRRNGGHVVTGVTMTPVLPLPLAISLIVGGFALAWWREGR